MKLAAALALVATTATVAAAEPYDATETRKNPDVALGLSIGGTAASIGLIALGANLSEREGGGMIATVGALSLIATPALGEMYSGKYFTAGMGMRLAGGGFAVLAAAEALSHLCFGSFDNGPSDSTCNDSGPDYAPIALLGVGASLVVAGTIYDIVKAPGTAEHWNNTHHLMLSPTVIPSQSGPTAGMALGGTF